MMQEEEVKEFKQAFISKEKIPRSPPDQNQKKGASKKRVQPNMGGQQKLQQNMGGGGVQPN